MKPTSVFVFFVLATILVVCRGKPAEERIEKLTSSDLNCLLKDAPCSKRLAEVKTVIEKAFKDSCKSCTEDEKRSAGDVLGLLFFNKSKVWNKFVNKYDHQKQHKELYIEPYAGEDVSKRI